MKIGFCGSQGTGKTTVAEYMQGMELFSDFYFPPSSARELKELGINKEANPLGQLLITVDRHNQTMSEEHVLIDRTLLDSWAYTNILKESFNVPELYFSVTDEFVLQSMKHIDLLVYFPVYWPPQADGVRSLDENYQRDIDLLIRDAMNIFCPYHETLTMEDESVECRVDKIVAAVEELDLI